jgi:putative endonuclease
VNAGERRAARHYRLRGYTVLDANARAGGYELDLVLRRGRCLVFCEVKEKRDGRFGAPAEMVDVEKRRRVRRAAGAWLAARPALADLTVRFEVAAIEDGRIRRLPDDGIV